MPKQYPKEFRDDVIKVVLNRDTRARTRSAQACDRVFVTGAELTAAYRANALFDAHVDDPEFGYRFLADEAQNAGEVMSERTAWRICRDNGWWSVFGKKSLGKHGRPGPAVHDDLVERDFTAAAVNELLLADITEHQTRDGRLYLCAIKDVCSNWIVGYSIDSRMKSSLAIAALRNAVMRRGDVAGCVLHTDRGSQFRSRKFVRSLEQHAMVGSMGRVGAAGDNAAMESFFSLLQKNVLDRKTWVSVYVQILLGRMCSKCEPRERLNLSHLCNR